MDNMTLKLGQVQLMVGRDKAENLRRACVLIRRAAEQGAQLVMLPEMFCCPYENEMFRPNSEEQGGPAQQALSALSRELETLYIRMNDLLRDLDGRTAALESAAQSAAQSAARSAAATGGETE